MRLIFACFTLLALAAGSHAEVYVCEDNGHKTYSQEPCGKDAKVVTTEATHGSITISPNMNLQSWESTCRLMMRSVDVASKLAQENVNYELAEKRIFGYLRDHITNFKEVVRQEPDFYSTLEEEARMMTNVGYRTARSGVTDDDIENVVAQCTKEANDHWQQQGHGGGAVSQHRTAVKMM